jgi:cellulose synthase operon protein C
MGRRVRGSGFVGVLALLATVALLPAPVPGAVSLAPSSASEAEPAVAQDALEEARAHLRTGRYEEAEAAFAAILSGSSAAPPSAPSAALRTAAHEGLFLARMAVGRHAEAEAAARAGEAEVGAALSVRLGEALLARGRLDEAEAAFRRGAADGAPDRLMALHHLAALEEERGNREAALGGFDAFIDLYNAGAARTARELVAVGLAVQALGAGDPDLFRDALRAFDEAAAADPRDPEPALRAGALFLSRYNGADARASFEEVLATNPRDARALLGRARALDFAREGGAMAAVEAALEVNPSLVEARVFLGRLRLGLEEADRAAAEAERALEVNPASLEALALLAAARSAAGDARGAEEARVRRRALNPRDPGLALAEAEASANRRRYAEAVAFAREAVALDATAWEARGLLGINLLRLGAMEEGRRELERAFAGDPYNVWFKNTLDLLDSLERYREVEAGPFVIVVREDEADLLVPLVAELAEEAWADLLARYPAAPETPVRIELYPNSADFSVRTVGLAGIGALGVAFGRVVAMDSPTARRPGELNWASVLWHELAHVVHLARSESAMPRWFGEGLAVYEQHRARPGWGMGPTPGLLRAWDEGRLPPPSELNRSFVRPRTPDEVGLAYGLAALVCTFLAETRGEAVLDAMLVAWGEGLATDEVFRRAVGMEPAAVDVAFDAWMRSRFAGPLAALSAEAGPDDPASFVHRMREGVRLLEAGRPGDARPHLEAARALFPEYGGADGPDAFLARLHREAGDEAAAREALARLLDRNETHLEGARALGELAREAGDLAGAIRGYARVAEIYPRDVELHRVLAELHEEAGAWDRVITARRAVLGLAPTDRAAAHYELARALLEAGEVDAARREVLRSLETAPSFEAAQELLLRIRGVGP